MSQAHVSQSAVHGAGSDEALHWASQLTQAAENREWAIARYGQSALLNLPALDVSLDLMSRGCPLAPRSLRIREFVRCYKFQHMLREKREQEVKMKSGSGLNANSHGVGGGGNSNCSCIGAPVLRSGIGLEEAVAEYVSNGDNIFYGKTGKFQSAPWFEELEELVRRSWDFYDPDLLPGIVRSECLQKKQLFLKKNY